MVDFCKPIVLHKGVLINKPTNLPKLNHNAEYVAQCVFKAIETVLLVGVDELKSPGQCADLVFARKAYYIAMHRYSHLTYQVIGRQINHSRTVVSRQLEKALAEEAQPQSRLSGTMQAIQQFLKTINLHPVK